MQVARKGKQQRKRSGKERVSASQIQAYRARQEAVLSREEVEKRLAEERRREREREEQAVARAEGTLFESTARSKRQDDEPRLTPEQIAAEYAGVRQELVRIAVLGGLSFALLGLIAIYMS